MSYSFNQVNYFLDDKMPELDTVTLDSSLQEKQKKYVEYFRNHFIEHLKKEIDSNLEKNQAKFVIEEAKKSHNISRIFDAFTFPNECIPSLKEIDLLENDTITLRKYLQDLIIQITPLLLNDAKTELHANVIEAIGELNYQEIVSTKDKKLFAEQILKAVVISYGQRLVDTHQNNKERILSILSKLEILQKSLTVTGFAEVERNNISSEELIPMVNEFKMLIEEATNLNIDTYGITDTLREASVWLTSTDDEFKYLSPDLRREKAVSAYYKAVEKFINNAENIVNPNSLKPKMANWLIRIIRFIFRNDKLFQNKSEKQSGQRDILIPKLNNLYSKLIAEKTPNVESITKPVEPTIVQDSVKPDPEQSTSYAPIPTTVPPLTSTSEAFKNRGFLIKRCLEFTQNLLKAEELTLTTDIVNTKINNFDVLSGSKEGAALIQKLLHVALKGDQFLAEAKPFLQKVLLIQEQLHALEGMPEQLIDNPEESQKLQHILAEIQSLLPEPFIELLAEQMYVDSMEVSPLLSDLQTLDQQQKNAAGISFGLKSEKTGDLSYHLAQKYGLLFQKLPSINLIVKEVNKSIEDNIKLGNLNRDSKLDLPQTSTMLEEANRKIAQIKLPNEFLAQLHANLQTDNFIAVCDKLMDTNYAAFAIAFNRFLTDKKIFKLVKKDANVAAQLKNINQKMINIETDTFASLTHDINVHIAERLQHFIGQDEQFFINALYDKKTSQLTQDITQLEQQIAATSLENTDSLSSLNENLNGKKLQLSQLDPKSFSAQDIEKFRYDYLEEERKLFSIKAGHHTDFINYYIEKTILSQTSIAARTLAYGHCIDVISNLIVRKDYNTALILFSSLSRSYIGRLEATINSLSSNHQNEMKKFEKLFNPERNYAFLRDEIATTDNASEPFVMTGKDIFTFIDANKSKIGIIVEGQTAKPLNQHDIILDKNKTYQHRIANSSSFSQVNQAFKQFILDQDMPAHSKRERTLTAQSKALELSDQITKSSKIYKKLRRLHTDANDDANATPARINQKQNACTIELLAIASQTALELQKELRHPSDTKSKHMGTKNALVEHFYDVKQSESKKSLKTGTLFAAVCLEPRDTSRPIVIAISSTTTKYLESASQFYEKIRLNYPDRQIILTGYAEGGYIARQIALKSNPTNDSSVSNNLLMVRTFNSNTSKNNELQTSSLLPQCINYNLKPPRLSTMLSKKSMENSVTFSPQQMTTKNTGTVSDYLPRDISSQSIGNTRGNSKSIDSSLVELIQGILNCNNCVIQGHSFTQFDQNSKEYDLLRIQLSKAMKKIQQYKFDESRQALETLYNSLSVDKNKDLIQFLITQNKALQKMYQDKTLVSSSVTNSPISSAPSKELGISTQEEFIAEHLAEQESSSDTNSDAGDQTIEDIGKLDETKEPHDIVAHQEIEEPQETVKHDDIEETQEIVKDEETKTPPEIVEEEGDPEDHTLDISHANPDSNIPVKNSSTMFIYQSESMKSYLLNSALLPTTAIDTVSKDELTQVSNTPKPVFESVSFPKPGELRCFDMTYTIQNNRNPETNIKGRFTVESQPSEQKSSLHNKSQTKYSIQQFPAATISSTHEELNAARVTFAMTVAVQFLSNMNPKPSKNHPIQLRGRNVEEIKYLWTAFALIGKHVPNLGFSTDYISCSNNQFDSSKEKKSSQFANDSLYETVFKKHAVEYNNILKDFKPFVAEQFKKPSHSISFFKKVLNQFKTEPELEQDDKKVKP